MSKARVSLDDVYANSKCDGSMFKAVKMMAEEARFINEQANMGFIELTKKPTTIAMGKFLDERLEVVPEVSEEISDESAEELISSIETEIVEIPVAEELPSIETFIDDEEPVAEVQTDA
tara:strand:- start:124 stop:480 length:357 start_codon:yes stop_codon:yes gene_type:complete